MQMQEEYPCHIVNSNHHLNYDDSMFNRRTGLLKECGMKIIFKHIYEMICSISAEQSYGNEIQSVNDKNLFFR